jgi:hypothetical protein
MRNNVLRCQLEGEPLASRENGERPKSAKRDFCKRLAYLTPGGEAAAAEAGDA